MEKLQKTFLIIVIVLLVFIPVWMFLIVPELEKIPEDYDYGITSHGENKIFDPETNQWKSVLQEQTRNERVIEVSSGSLVIESELKGIKKVTDEVLWETSVTFGVDRITRENTGERTSLFTFPPHLEKKAYIMQTPEMVHPEMVKFEKVEFVRELETYKFSYYLEPSDLTVHFPWIKGYIVKGDHGGTIWVEPVSGRIVRWVFGGDNKLFDPSTLEEIRDLNTWSLEFGEDTISNQVRLAQNEKQQIILYEITIPALLAIMAIAFLVVYHLGGLKKSE